MFLMYVDECGDCGMGVGASDYFVLSAMVVHESQWTDLMQRTASAFAAIYSRYGLDRRNELHAKAMLARSDKAYTKINKHDRVLLLRDVMFFEMTLTDCVRVINVVVSKSGKPADYNVFEHAWDALINRFENTMQNANFPIVKPGTQPAYPEHGIVIVDETDEKKLRELIRRMRHMNMVPSAYGGDALRSDLRWVVEDAMHKQSQHSMTIQMCDVNAYFLRQKISPNSTVKKHNARFFFEILDPILLKEASRKDRFGVVWL